jgi:2-oxoglutarate-dependent dioxygenase
MTDPVLSRSLTPGELAAYHGEGFVVLKGLLSPEIVDAIHGDVMQIMETIGLGHTALKQTSEYLPGTALDALVNSEGLRQLASALMDGPARLYLPFTAVKSPGGGGAFHFHQDNQYTRFDGPGINLWAALGPMREENGCLWMVPHSHYLGTLPSVKDAAGKVHDSGIEPLHAVAVPMEPGDVVAFSRLTVHGSGINRTDAPRVAYAVQYAREDVRYTRDHGASWQALAEHGPGWRVGPVKKLTVPESRDGH